MSNDVKQSYFDNSIKHIKLKVSPKLQSIWKKFYWSKSSLLENIPKIVTH